MTITMVSIKAVPVSDQVYVRETVGFKHMRTRVIFMTYVTPRVERRLPFSIIIENGNLLTLTTNRHSISTL